MPPMKRCLASAVTLCIPLLSACASHGGGSASSAESAAALRIDHATVIDPRNGTSAPDMTVFIAGDKIISVRPTAKVGATPKVEAIDAAGRYLVPGFNNMHSHVLSLDNPAGALALMLSEGVTGFRQMSGSDQLLAARHNAALAIGADAPRLLSMPGDFLTPKNAPSPPAAVAEVQRQQSLGADFIKVGLVSPDVFFAVTTEARRRGLRAVGHLQEGVAAVDASDAGFHIEHLGPGDSIWIDCSSNKAALHAAALTAAAHAKMPPAQLAKLFEHLPEILENPAAYTTDAQAQMLQQAFDSYSEQACHAVARRFAANGTWNTPTLVRLRTQELADDPQYKTSPDNRYIAPAALARWSKSVATFKRLPETTRSTLREEYKRNLALTSLFDRAGVKMMAGTDGSGEAPGQTLAAEFDELAAAGLSPLRILQMTTSLPAEFLGQTASTGAIEAGKKADIVILDADPTVSTANLHKISGVIRGGHNYTRQALDDLRSKVAAGVTLE